MGLLNKLFGRKPDNIQGSTAYQTLTAYSPQWTSGSGQLYENETIRSSIDALARHTSKLRCEVVGTDSPLYKFDAPNELQSWSQFLYRARTIYELENNVFIVPVYNDYGLVSGFYPVLPNQCELLEYNGDPWMRYRFKNGKTAAIELSKMAIISKHQYKDDVFGEKNSALNDTLQLINLNSQGIREGIKNGASYRFMARLTNFAKPADMKAERERFTRDNLSADQGGVLLLPNTWADIKQLTNQTYAINPEQIQSIQQNVYNYFGVNEDVLQNKAYGDAWVSFYEGAIEPFALQLGEGLTKMTFRPDDIADGAQIMFTANRLQYLSNKEKLDISSQMLDRGILNRDEIRDIWNLPPLPNGEGQKYYLRGEYKTNDNGPMTTTDEGSNVE